MRLRPWFRIEERQEALQAAAKRWLGTPFFPNNASCGAGVGCVDLVHALWLEAGAIAPMAIPTYTLDHGHHQMRSQLLRFLLDEPQLVGRLQFVPASAESLPGDLIACKSGHLDHHLVCALPWGKFIHAHSDYGVQILDQSERVFVERRLYTLRLMEVVES